MIVAIHISRSLHLYPEPFNLSFAKALAEKQPENQFILIFDADITPPPALTANSKHVNLQYSPKSKLNLWYTYSFRIPAILKKTKADIFITAGDICSMNTKVPQWVIFHDPEIQKPAFRKTLQRRKKAIAKKAAQIFTAGNLDMAGFSKKPVIALHPPPQVMGINENDAEKKIQANAFTEESGYFLFISPAADEGDYIRMLKAFSVFKKWQRSSMQLAIYACGEKFDGLPSLSSYLYRDDVKIILPGPEISEHDLLSSAYAVISFSGFTAAAAGIRSMLCRIPFITADREGNRRLFEENCLYAKENDRDLGQKLILIYKDEVMKNELAQKGWEHAKTYTSARCAGEIAGVISAHN